MGLELTIPGTIDIQIQQANPYTHVLMVGLRFQFPALNQNTNATIFWRKGILDGGGKFSSYEQQETVVPELTVRNWLTAKNTENKANFIKLEEAMYAHLVNRGEITDGTVVVIPE